MEVGVRVEAEDLLSGVKRHTNTCYLTFVAIDANGRPIPVRPLKLETDIQKRHWNDAKRRREYRQELAKELGEEGYS